ncbi:hypothetical protein N9902_02865, partial [Akkermansiaceae bacterium]|nr:hypothetical protein [Akkermansiaceae bacterium]MDB4816946.1 hypothetical protein [bacterium]
IMLLQFQCQKCQRNITSSYDSYYSCSRAEHGMKTIVSCLKCYEEGETACGDCGDKLIFHNGNADHELGKNGMMF